MCDFSSIICRILSCIVLRNVYMNAHLDKKKNIYKFFCFDVFCIFIYKGNNFKFNEPYKFVFCFLLTTLISQQKYKYV